MRVRKVAKDERASRRDEALEMVRLGGYGARKPSRALRRPAPAGRARALDRQPPASPAARRAARRARPEAARADAGRAQADPARGPDHLRLRHPRPGGGADDVGPDRGLQRGPDRAGRQAGGDLRGPPTPFVAAFVGVSNPLERDGRRFTIRPEKIRMVEPTASDTAGLTTERGRIVDVAYAGMITRYLVALDAGESFKSSARTSRRPPRRRSSRSGGRWSSDGGRNTRSRSPTAVTRGDSDAQ